MGVSQHLPSILWSKNSRRWARNGESEIKSSLRHQVAMVILVVCASEPYWDYSLNAKGDCRTPENISID